LALIDDAEWIGVVLPGHIGVEVGRHLAWQLRVRRANADAAAEFFFLRQRLAEFICTCA
jgi:hypothetical protein